MTRNHLLAGLAAGLLLFNACSQPAPPAMQPTVSAPAASEPASSDLGGTANADDVIARLEAARAQVRTYSMEMKMDMAVMGKEAAITMAGQMDETDQSNVKMVMDMEFAGMKMKMLRVDNEMYMKLDATGDMWMKVPEDQMSQYESTTNSTDVVAKLQEVRDSIKLIESLGTETVDGVQTTHHRISIDGSALSKLTGSEGEIDADTFVYDIWLDDADLVRRVSMDLKAKIDGRNVPFKIDGRMSHYNEPVDIKAPAKNQIMDMPS